MLPPFFRSPTVGALPSPRRALQIPGSVDKPVPDVGEAAPAKAKEKGEKLAASQASPWQMMHIIKTCIKPAITCGFCAAPYTMGEVALLDRQIAAIVRKCWRLPHSHPTSAILRDLADAGLGAISLTIEYAQISAACLTRASLVPHSCLNYDGHLGAVMKALLDLQR